MRIAIVDDHRLFRNGIATLLEKIKDVEVVVEASNGKEFLDKLKNCPVDLVLLDLKMPIMDGRNTMIELQKTNPEVKILILTMEGGEETILRCIEEGANGFLPKDAHPGEVRLAIQSIRQTGNYLNAKTSQIMMRGLSNWNKGLRSSGIQLSEREMLVLKGVCQQKTTADIAKEMFLSPRTIEGYRRDLLEKTGNKNSVGLVLFAAKNGWLAKWMNE